jgi:hypothetical protein
MSSKGFNAKAESDADRAVQVALEVRLTRAEADSLATRLPRIRAMIQAGVLFFRDTRDREDLMSAFEKLEARLALSGEPFEVADWPPRPAPKVGRKPPMGRRANKADSMIPGWQEPASEKPSTQKTTNANRQSAGRRQ